MHGRVGDLREQFVQIEDVVGEVIVASAPDPLALAVAAPVEGGYAVAGAGELARDGVEAPRDVEETVAQDDIHRPISPADDVMREPIGRQRLLGRDDHVAGSSNRLGESAWASLD
jgi:hypothetical protein